MSDAPHIGPVDPHVPLGACCVYKITHIATGMAYIGKTVWPLERYIKYDHMKRKGWFGNALRKHGRAAFRSEILLVGTEDFCFRDVIDGKRGGMERALIAAFGTLRPNGYNLGEGGEGYTSEEAQRFANSPAGRAANARSCETIANRAGYPQRRVLAALEKGPRSIDSLAASLGFTRRQVLTSFAVLRRNGHHITGERGGLFRLGTFEEAIDAWASGRKLTNHGRMLGLLMKAPRTGNELAAAAGVPRNFANGSMVRLRKNGYNIESRGEGGNIPGIFHLIIDHKRHPWMHLGALDLRGAAYDDRA